MLLFYGAGGQARRVRFGMVAQRRMNPAEKVQRVPMHTTTDRQFVRKTEAGAWPMPVCSEGYLPEQAAIRRRPTRRRVANVIRKR